MPSVLPEDMDGSSQHGPIQEEAELRGVVGEGSDEARSPQEVEAGLWSDASLPMVSQSHAAGDDELDKQDRTSLGTLSQSEEDFSEIGTIRTAGDLKTGRTMTTTTLGDGTLTGRTNLETKRSNIMSAQSSKAERMGSVLGSARGPASARASARALQSARVSIASDFPLLTDRKPNPEPAVTLQLYGKEQPIPEGARSEEPPSHSIVVQPEQSFADVIEFVSEMVGFKAVFEYSHMDERVVVDSDEAFDALVDIAAYNGNEAHCRLREAFFGGVDLHRPHIVVKTLRKVLFAGCETKDDITRKQTVIFAGTIGLVVSLTAGVLAYGVKGLFDAASHIGLPRDINRVGCVACVFSGPFFALSLFVNQKAVNRRLYFRLFVITLCGIPCSVLSLIGYTAQGDYTGAFSCCLWFCSCGLYAYSCARVSKVMYYKSLDLMRRSSLCPCVKPLPDDEDGEIHRHQNDDDEQRELNQEAKKILEEMSEHIDEDMTSGSTTHRSQRRSSIVDQMKVLRDRRVGILVLKTIFYTTKSFFTYLLAFVWLVAQVTCTMHAFQQAVFPVEDYGVRVSTGSGWEYSHLLCYGFTDGSETDSRPPVIIQTGEGVGAANAVKTVLQKIGQAGVACSYDRNGFGLSSVHQHSMNSSKSVENKLKYLLEKGSNLAPPAVRIGPTDKHPVSPKYLLVGHSTGSIYNRRFALKWPHLVAALVNWDGIPSTKRLPDEGKATEISGNGGGNPEGAQESGESAGSGVAALLGGDDVWIESELQRFMSPEIFVSCMRVFEPLGFFHAVSAMLFTILFPTTDRKTRDGYGELNSVMWLHEWCPTVKEEYEGMYQVGGDLEWTAEREFAGEGKPYDMPVVAWARNHTCTRAWMGLGLDCWERWYSDKKHWIQNGVPTTWVDIQQGIAELSKRETIPVIVSKHEASDAPYMQNSKVVAELADTVLRAWLELGFETTLKGSRSLRIGGGRKLSLAKRLMTYTGFSGGGGAVLLEGRRGTRARVPSDFSSAGGGGGAIEAELRGLVGRHVAPSSSSPRSDGNSVRVRVGGGGELEVSASWFSELDDAELLLTCRGGASCRGVSARAVRERDALYRRHGLAPEEL